MSARVWGGPWSGPARMLRARIPPSHSPALCGMRLVLFVLALALGALARDASGGCTPDDDSFDYFLLALQWPPAFGRLVSHFTIHGLWPSRSVGDATTYPCNCGKSEQFDLGKLQPIRKKLETDWPSLKSNDDASFWEHEWSKH